MSNKVKTPEYWKDKFFQPLVKAKTVNGHEVMIPRLFEKAWQGMELHTKVLPEMDAQIAKEIDRDISPDKISFRRVISTDIRKVYYEVWRESLPQEIRVVKAYLKR